MALLGKSLLFVSCVVVGLATASTIPPSTTETTTTTATSTPTTTTTTATTQPDATNVSTTVTATSTSSQEEDTHASTITSVTTTATDAAGNAATTAVAAVPSGDVSTTTAADDVTVTDGTTEGDSNDTTTTTTTSTTTATTSAPQPPFYCYDCNSGSPFAGMWSNGNCAEDGYVTYTPTHCTSFCFSAVGLYPAGTVFRGCANALWMPGQTLEDGCFDDTNGNRRVCLCSGDECNTHNMTLSAQDYVQEYLDIHDNTVF